MEILEIFQQIRTPMTILHVLVVVVGMGAALMSDLLFSFFSKDKKLNSTEISTLEILAKIVFYSLIFISLSGIGIFLSDIDKYTHSAKFLSKMSILAILLINGYVLNKYIWPHLLNRNFFTLKKERNIRRLAFVCGSISVISWLAVLGLGVLDTLAINYTTTILAYLFAISVGSLIALVVERVELN